MQMDPIYFRVVQPRMHHTCLPREFIYSYSFALQPELASPSGAINMSRIENVELRLEFTSALTQGFDLLVYATNYNVLRIMSGMGGLAYSN